MNAFTYQARLMIHWRSRFRHRILNIPHRNMDRLLAYCEAQWDSLLFDHMAINLSYAPLVATQDTLDGDTLLDYLCRTRLVDRNRQLPYVACVEHTFYILDGHHRWMAARLKKRKILRVQFVTLDAQTINQPSRKEIHIEPIVTERLFHDTLYPVEEGVLI